MAKEFTMQGPEETDATMVQFTISDLASAKKAIDYLFDQTNLISRTALIGTPIATSPTSTPTADSYASIRNALMTHDEYSNLQKTTT